MHKVLHEAYEMPYILNYNVLYFSE